MNPPAEIETTRLHLRKPVMDDAGVIFESWAQDPEVTRYLLWRRHQNIDETNAFLKRCLSVWENSSAFPYLIVLKQTRLPISSIELRIHGNRAEVGYALARRHWGNGYMTEAVQAIVDWSLKQKEIFRIQATCDLENRASARVLEKAEMQREAVLRRWAILPSLSEEPRDFYLYARVRQFEPPR